jgi:hypothetical protein
MMDNVEKVYVFTGKKIIEKKVQQCVVIDEDTVFIRLPDIGPLFFDKGVRVVSKGDLKIGLSENCFHSEVFELCKKEMNRIQGFIQYHSKMIAECYETIERKKQDIEFHERNIESFRADIARLKEKARYEQQSLYGKQYETDSARVD